MTPTAHSIGHIAKETNKSVSAIRYYETLGLIGSAERIGGKRRFAPSTIGRINFIRRAQETGFSLDEIGSLLDDAVGGWRDLVDTKIAELHGRREQIEAMLDVLIEIRKCGCEAVGTCQRHHLPD